MRLDRVQPGDVIKAAIKGRTGIWGEVTEVKDGTVYFRPLCPATGWRHASAHEVVGHRCRRAAAGLRATRRLRRYRSSSSRSRGSIRRPAKVIRREIRI